MLWCGYFALPSAARLEVFGIGIKNTYREQFLCIGDGNLLAHLIHELVLLAGRQISQRLIHGVVVANVSVCYLFVLCACCLWCCAADADKNVLQGVLYFGEVGEKESREATFFDKQHLNPALPDWEVWYRRGI